MRKSCLTATAVAAALGIGCPLPPAPVSAQVPAPAAVAVPPDAELDAMLAARNWNGLSAALQPLQADSIVKVMKWLGAQIRTNGGTFLLDLVYTRDLWLAGNAQPIDDPMQDMRVTAATMALYSYAIVLIDGSKCDDDTALTERATLLLRTNAPIVAFLKAQPAQVQSSAIDMAIALEKKTAAQRKEDDLICRAGMAQMRAGLERGTQREMPSQPGMVGKSIGVTPPPDWEPRFAPPEVYKPKQEKARAEMAVMLRKLIE